MVNGFQSTSLCIVYCFIYETTYKTLGCFVSVCIIKTTELIPKEEKKIFTIIFLTPMGLLVQ